MKVNFQIILIAVFLAFFIFAVLIFSGILPIGKTHNPSTSTSIKGHIIIWGTLPGSGLTELFKYTSTKDLTFTYVQKPVDQYQQLLIEAFAKGDGPDLFFITEDMVLKNKTFLYTIPYTTYSEKIFRDTYIDGADIYMDSDGINAIPIVVDPMVMYYNKTFLDNEGVSLPPTYWDELFPLVDKLTKKKSDGTISQSTIALGTYDNITHAKDILSLLLMQSGNPITIRNGNLVSSNLKGKFNLNISPIESVLSFYTSFSNALDSAYSWNRGLLPSIDMFTGSKLTFYLGRASELFKIESVNPNLSFNVTNVPQTRGTNVIRTYGKIYGLAISNRSLNSAINYSVLGLLTTPDNIKNISAGLSLPPANRVLLTNLPANPYLDSFFRSAIVTRTWLDPESLATDKIFGDLLSNVLSNKLTVSAAVAKADEQINSLLSNN